MAVSASRIDSLQKKREDIKRRIELENRSPNANDGLLRRLKKENLLLKEEIVRGLHQH